MKKIVLLLNLLALFITAFAQSPYGFHYQAIVQNDSLRILANTAVEVRTSILTETNYIVYREVQPATTDEFGLLSIEVGIGTTEVGAFNTIPWGSEPYFLQSEITPVEGGGDPIVITERIMSVPYAFFANETEQDFSGNYNDLTNKPNLFDGNYYHLINRPLLKLVALTGDYHHLEDTITFAPVATSGSYHDLTDTITFAPVATSGNYNDLTNKPAIPTIPTNVSAFSNDAGYLTSTQFNNLVNTAIQQLDSLTQRAQEGALCCAIPAGDGLPCPEAPTVTVENIVYHTVKIGQQCWMKENLRVTQYADGKEIPLGTTTSDNIAYRYYPNNNSANVSDYGYLYNWTAIMHGAASSSANPSLVQGICPTGWHLPSNAEWTDLTDYISNTPAFRCENNSSNIAKAMAATTGWNSSNSNCAVGNDQGANNTTGFDAVPAGRRANGFNNFGTYADMWSATSGGATTAWSRNLNAQNNFVATDNQPVSYGFSVRCVRGTGYNLAAVTTAEVTTIGFSGATAGGNVTYSGNTTVTERGVCWSTSHNPTVAGAHTPNGNGVGSFIINLTGLAQGTTYYVRAYATNSMGTRYGEEVSFTTNQQVLPTVTTGNVSNIAYTTASCGGNVTDDGGATVTARGLCWATTANPTVNGQHLQHGNGLGSFTDELTNLTPGTTYHVRAYATNSVGTAYGDDVTFTTNALVLPTVTTTAPTQTGNFNATGGGEVTFDGGATVSERGVCWSTSHNPTINHSKATSGNGSGAFTSTLSNLNPGTTYYVRAYATNSVGTSYGEEYTLTMYLIVPKTGSESYTLTSTATVYDHGGPNHNYDNGCFGQLTISAGSTSKVIRISGNYNTQNNSDKIYVYDGSGISTLITELTGSGTLTTPIFSTQNSVTIMFTSDGSGTQNGFALQVEAIDIVNPSSITISGSHVSCDGNPVLLTATSNVPGTYTWSNGATGSQISVGAGNYTVTITTSSNHKMSSDEFIVTSHNTVYHDFSATVCDEYNWNGTLYTQSGNYTQTFTAATGCDSIVTLHLTVHPSAHTHDYVTINENELPFTYLNHVFGLGTPAETTMDFNLSTIHGCDSIVTLHLTVNLIPAGDGQTCPEAPSVTDIDGNVYQTVKIGDQCWMKENLRVTHYADGSAIPVGGSTTSSTDPYYYTNPNLDAATYGYYYNWAAIMHGMASSSADPSNVQGICPAGWHLPSDAEWTDLTNYVSNTPAFQCSGNSNNIAKALSSSTGWNTSDNGCDVGGNTNLNNATGFSAVPGGYCYGTSFDLIGTRSYFWSSSENMTNRAWTRDMNYNAASVSSYGLNYKYHGYSVRCVQGNGINLAVVTTDDVTNIAAMTATCGGNVTYAGNTALTGRGVCWSTSPNPTVSDSHTDNGTNTGNFISSLIDLTPNTTYYVRAYAINAAGTVYGEQRSFTTSCNTVPLSIAGNGTISYGQSTTLTASGANTYAWSTGQSTSTITVSPATTTTYTVTGTNQYGCTATVSKTVTVNFLIPTVITNNYSNVSTNSATCGGNVTANGGSAVTARGVCWSTSPNPTVSGNHTTDGAGTGNFTSNITGLIPNTTYYVRAYATNSAGTGYGEELSFTTPCNTVTVTIAGNTTINYGQSTTLTASGANSYAWSTGQSTAAITVSPATTTTYTVTGTNQYGCTATASKTVTVNFLIPTVITSNVSNIATNSAICGGNVTANGGTNVTARGVCWSTTPNPTVSGSHTTDGSGNGSFTSNITGLTPNTTYYVRAYATNSAGTAYGIEKSFTTSCNTVIVSISGNAEINYGQSTTLTASGASTYSWNNGETTPSITVNPTTNTTYMVTGTNQYGCTATATKTVTVNSVVPTVTTNTVTNVSTTTATCGGNVTSHGGANVTARGVCWSTSPNPTVSGQHTTNGSGTGSFTSNLTGLTPNTTYYVRAYATNSKGTAYGAERSFTTSCDNLTVTITGNSEINYGQNVTLSASGANTYVWSTGATTSSITVSPTSTTTYTVTGTNQNGCTASASKTVTVHFLVPTVTTSNVSNIAQTSASCGGSVTADGGANVTARGICWSTSPNPMVNGSHTTNGSGLGNFSSSISGLTPNTTYYVRAYATNSAGTGYGEVKTFTTLCNTVNVSIAGNTTINHGQSTTLTASGATTYHWSTGASTTAITVSPVNTTSYTVTGTNQYGCTATATKSVTVNHLAPTVTTHNASTITTNSAICGGNVTSDGGESVTARGVCWSTGHNPTISNSHTTNGTGTGSFTSNITGLSDNTTYYVRAYATNSIGTSYGNEVHFTTTAHVIPTRLDIDGNRIVCENQTTTLTASSDVAGTYQWSNGQSGTTTTVGAGHYTVTITTSTNDTMSASVTVTQAPNYNIDTYLAICENELPYTYGNTVIPVGTAAQSTHTLHLTTIHGCDSTVILHLTILPMPVLTHTHDTIVPASVPVTLWASGASQLTWKGANGNVLGTGNTLTVSPSTTTTYTVTGTVTSNVPNAPVISCETVETITVTTLPAGDALPCPGLATVTDIDGNTYNTVKIGQQCWMKENLRVTRYADNTTIGLGTTTSTSTPYRYNPNNSENNVSTYGYLYNWPAVMHGMASSSANPSNVQGVCPTGWHVPSDAEWTELTNYLSNHSVYVCGNDNSNITKALSSTTGWWNYTSPCAPGDDQSHNNTSGFSAVASGHFSGNYGSFGEGPYFWTSTQDNSSTAYSYNWNYSASSISRAANDKYSSFSVRCLHGNGVNLAIVTTDNASNIAQTTATCGGNVTYDGNTLVTARGVCWSTSHNPTINTPQHTTDGTGTGLFTSSLTGLSDNTTYYVRAYATNSAGTVYGNEVSFTTSANIVPHEVSITGSHTVCGQQTTTLTAHSDVAGTFHWSNGQDGQQITVGVGTYRVTVTSATGHTKVSDPFEVYIPTLAVEMDLLANNGQPCNLDTFVLAVTNHSIDNGDSFQWYKDNQLLTNETNDFITFLGHELGYVTYSVTVTSAEGCTGSDSYSFEVVRCIPPGDTEPCPGHETVTDYDGNTYGTVKIGNQCWMKENLRTTHYPDGTEIASGGNVPANNSQLSNTTPYRYVPNGNTANIHDYGYVYNWPAIMHGMASSSANPSGVQGICPDGWHLPSDAEWTDLTDYVSSKPGYVCSSNSANIAKSLASIIGWYNNDNFCSVGNNAEDNDITGFNAMPAGGNGGFGEGFYVWSATASNSNNAIGRDLSYTSATVASVVRAKNDTRTVRCILGDGLNFPRVTTNNVGSITPTTATCGGNVLYAGNTNLTARGVCWSTSPNPTVNDNKTTNGSNTGNFTSNLTGLTPNTTYYVRAYATNSVGTVYGEEKVFTTSCNSVNLTISGNTTINHGQSTTITASGANTYVWSTGASSAAITVSPTATTTYTVTGTNQYGCTATASATVTVNTLAPTVTTTFATSSTSSTANCGGNVTSDGGLTVTARGMCWSTSHNPTVSGPHTTDGTGTGPFTSDISGLNSNTTYYVRAYATNSKGTSYGEELSFTTACDNMTVTISGNGTIDYGQSTTLTASGATTYTWSTGATGASITVTPTTTTIYSVTGSNPNGCSASVSKTVTVNFLLPTVTTGNITNITTSTANGGGNVTADGGAAITARGVCWSTSHNPTVSDSHTTDGTGTGAFSSSITGLTLNTTYYVRAYATNSTGTAYGEEKSFTTESGIPASDTHPCSEAPTVTDIDDNVYQTVKLGNQCWMKENLRTTRYADGTTILMGSSLSNEVAYRYYPNNNDNNVETYGYLYNWAAVMRGMASSNANPSNVQGICPTGWHVPSDAEWTELTDYVSTIPAFGCNGDSTKIAKALASESGWDGNNGSCAVGNNQSTNNSTNFSALPAGYYGYSVGGFGNDASLWSATISNTNTSYAFGRYLYPNLDTVGVFNHNQNFGRSVRCVLGNGVNLPSVSTSAANATDNDNPTSATSGGNVTYDGNTTVTARGVCWSTSHNPTINGSHTTDGTGTGVFTSTLTGLSLSTTYYVRAYATNSAGTVYGNEVSFTTGNGLPAGDAVPCPGTPTVTDIDGNTYNTVKIGNQCWMKENLRVTHYADGKMIPVGTSTNADVAYCYYPGNDQSNVSAYGYLYNWAAVMHGITSTSTNVQGVCPTGWHVPSDAEWNQLINYTKSKDAYKCSGSSNNIAKALASKVGWSSHSGNCSVGNDLSANNLTGFSAMPAGSLVGSNSYYEFGQGTDFWSTVSSGSKAWSVGMDYNLSTVSTGSNYEKWRGFSVRCIQGNGVNLPEVITIAASGIEKNQYNNNYRANCGGNVIFDGNTTITERGICYSTSSNPTVGGNITSAGTGSGVFTCLTTNLAANTTYYVRAYATNSAGTVYGNEIIVITGNDIPKTDARPCHGHDMLTDYDGNTYNTVQIGSQCWMKENLRTTHYADGTEIPVGTTYNTNVAYRYIPNDNSNNVPTYGYLYNWAAVMHGASSSSTLPSGVQGICPTGWHVPSNAEWNKLSAYMGLITSFKCNNNIAKALSGTMGWSSSENDCAPGNNQSLNNASGFNALPAGQFNQSIEQFGESANYWSATANNSQNSQQRSIFYNSGSITSENKAKRFGYSVRCILDEPNYSQESCPSSINVNATENWNSVLITWQVTGGIGSSSVFVYRNNAKLTLVPTTDTLFMDLAVSPNTNYHYEVRPECTGTVSSGSVDVLIPPISEADGQPCSNITMVQDYDHNFYHTVKIGAQCWLRENIRATHYSDGTSIALSSNSYSQQTAYRYYPNGQEANVPDYGYLYNWKAALGNASGSSEIQGVCPSGWHIPNTGEVAQLNQYLQNNPAYWCDFQPSYTAKVLANTTGWTTATNACSPGYNTATNNATGFSILPAGYVVSNSGASDFGNASYLWTSSQNGDYFGISANDNAITSSTIAKTSGISVRCIRNTVP